MTLLQEQNRYTQWSCSLATDGELQLNLVKPDCILRLQFTDSRMQVDVHAKGSFMPVAMSALNLTEVVLNKGPGGPRDDVPRSILITP